jgi:hypothetical protein
MPEQKIIFKNGARIWVNKNGVAKIIDGEGIIASSLWRLDWHCPNKCDSPVEWDIKWGRKHDFCKCTLCGAKGKSF